MGERLNDLEFPVKVMEPKRVDALPYGEFRYVAIVSGGLTSALRKAAALSSKKGCLVHLNMD